MGEVGEVGGPGSIFYAYVQSLIYIKLKRTGVTSEKRFTVAYAMAMWARS